MVHRSHPSDADIEREHRLLKLPGRSADATKLDALRVCLANCAEIRLRRRVDQPSQPDGKTLSTGDKE
jgi:hypothetical protein